jgi:hypothetical protein
MKVGDTQRNSLLLVVKSLISGRQLCLTFAKLQGAYEVFFLRSKDKAVKRSLKISTFGDMLGARIKSIRSLL